MSKKTNHIINTSINFSGNKHFCYLNGLLIGSFNTWHGANNYLITKVNELINKATKEQQNNSKRYRKKQPDIYHPRNQDDEATKAILEYHKSLKD